MVQCDEYLSIKEAAQMMHVSVRTVRRWVELGRIRPWRIGHTVRFKRAGLIRALDKYEYGAEPQRGKELG